MLNEKVTVTICGKAYNLRTDNASSLIRQGEEADRRITEYCRRSQRMTHAFSPCWISWGISTPRTPSGIPTPRRTPRWSALRRRARRLSRKTSCSPPKTSCSQRTAPPSRSYAGNTPSLKAKTPSSPKRSAKPTSAPSRTPAQRRSLKSPSRP